MKRKRYSNQTKAAVMAELLTGESVSRCSEKYGIPKGTVSGWKRKAIQEYVPPNFKIQIKPFKRPVFKRPVISDPKKRA